MMNSSPLGRIVEAPTTYSPELLCSIPRYASRQTCGLATHIVSCGQDTWTAYEMSWRNSFGVPRVAVLQCTVGANSPSLIESKSFKLYLNSFSETYFAGPQAVCQTVARDLQTASGAVWRVTIVDPRGPQSQLTPLAGRCIDMLDIQMPTETADAQLLRLSPQQSGHVEQTLCSELFKSLCPVTRQPDWGSIQVRYRGPQLCEAGLLRYLLSYRHHLGFHEICIEQIYSDLLGRCSPTHLSVLGRYTRRGGLDINPFRSNFEPAPPNVRTFRQ